MSQNDQSSKAENPYASPEIPSHAPGVAAAESSGAQHLGAFVGTNAQYYLDKWRPILSRWSPSAGFNWAAFFLSGLWLSYRKMYRLTLILYAIIILESILEDVVFVGMLGDPEPPAGLGQVVGLVAAIICGCYGNQWYLSHARRVISEVSATGLQGDDLVRTLVKRGGTSFAASLGMFVLFFAVIVAVFIPLDILLHEE